MHKTVRECVKEQRRNGYFWSRFSRTQIKIISITINIQKLKHLISVAGRVLFFVLKLKKNQSYLRSTISQEKLIKSEICGNIDASQIFEKVE